MKLAVTGKGGVGKTTLAALITRHMARRGSRVIAIDADPDANLASALGFTDASGITPIAEMESLIEERTGAEVTSIRPEALMTPSAESRDPHQYQPAKARRARMPARPPTTSPRGGRVIGHLASNGAHRREARAAR